MYTSNQTATGNSMQVQRQMHMSPEMKHCNSKSIKNANHDETQQQPSKSTLTLQTSSRASGYTTDKNS
jgi:hypothetical protein